MKIIRILLLLTSMSFCTFGSFAQTVTLQGVGYSANQATVTQGGKQIIYTFSTGSQVGATKSFKSVANNQMLVYTGMPMMAQYYGQVFGNNVFVSKGYYSGYVQLQWSILSSSSSIKKFYIYRKPVGQTGDSTLVTTTTGDVYSYRDEFVDKGTLYKYTIFAQGISDNLRLPYINYVESNGFATATGSTAGKITYAGGTAIAGVQVSANTNGTLGGKSILLNGTSDYLALEQTTTDTELELSNGFTWQAWVKMDGTNNQGIFSKGSNYSLQYQNGKFLFTVSNKTIQMTYTPPTGVFFHLTVNYSPGKKMKIYAIGANNKVDSLTDNTGSQPASGTLDNMYFGRASTNYLKGNLDEIRLWSRALPFSEVLSGYNRYIVGNETGIVGYWNLNSGVGDRFYDLSHKGYTYYENHGYLKGASQWSSVIPTISQLSYRGITDSQGNYTITGFPYESAGSVYTFTPMFDVHQFSPTQKTQFVGDGAAISNGVDFTDVSSFQVTGTINYRNSYFPVEGVSLSVDGNPLTTSEGTLVTTDKDGKFTIDVPIGKHSIRASKSQHTFQGGGWFPPRPAGKLTQYDFQAPLSGIILVDSTLVKVEGRVVGGPVQEAVPLGFNRSKNNLGASKIYITSEKGLDIMASRITKTKSGTTTTTATTTDSTVYYYASSSKKTNDASHSYSYIASEKFNQTVSAKFLPKSVEVTPNPATGEYVLYLPPERFTVTSVTANNGAITFDQSFNKTIDLTKTIKKSETLTDTIDAQKSSKSITGYPNTKAFTKTLYDSLWTITKAGITYSLGKVKEAYQLKQNFIYRVTPTITVTNDTGGSTFGETTYPNTPTNITLINTTNTTNPYSFGFPVFVQRNVYKMKVSVSEQYTATNVATNASATDIVPVTDGQIEIQNALAIVTDKVVLKLTSKGDTIYTFSAGLPNVNQDVNTPSNSYTKTLTLTAVTGNDGSQRTVWRDGNPFRAFVFGAMPQGNNFVTSGPLSLVAILRDPPGAESSTSLEKGSSVYSSESWSSTASINNATDVTVKMGLKVETVTGVGVAVVTSVESDYNIDTGYSLNKAWTKEGESTTTTDITKTISTSSDPAYVGADGDVFIGYSTNLVYGNALNLTPIPKTQCQNCTQSGVQESVQGSTTYKIGLQNSIRLNPQFATSFNYTQTYIESTLIPNLKTLRNKFLIYPDPGTHPASKVMYISKLAPTDKKFGANNDDSAVFGSSASSANNKQNGPSYTVYPNNPLPTNFVDSVRYFNQSIAEWQNLLKQNEESKVKATLIENISFDAGATYSSSKTVTSESSSTRSFEFAIDESVAVSTGTTINDGKTGLEGKITIGSGQGNSGGSSSGTSEYTTYTYNFADSNAGSYMSIDVKDGLDGYSPVFYLRAGATQCPYQGKEVTQFYNPGTLIGEATLAREKVSITVDKTSVSNVPENRAAEFTLQLSNNSETKEDTWYDLKVDDNTNPNGAVLEIDGLPLGNGRSFFVPAGTSLQKILKVRKGTAKILDYENLSLFFGSQCNGSVADKNLVVDTIKVSAHFQAGCSDIAFSTPVDKWVLNTNVTPSNVLPVLINSYDLNYGNFKLIRFQYKPTATSQWTTNYEFYNKNFTTQSDYDKVNGNKSWIDNTAAAINYQFDMSSLPDRAYDVRALAVCVPGPGTEIITPTDILTGIKDVQPPAVFGTPQPADGILSAGEDISVRFSEPIESGILTTSNFSVRGVLNGYKIANNTSVTLNGVDNYIRIPDGLSLSKSFTVEFWLQRNSVGMEEVVYSKGYSSQDAVQLGFSAANKMFIEIGSQRIESTASYTDTDWHHYALAYNADKNQISVYKDDGYVIDSKTVTTSITGQGTIWIGKSISDNRYANINIHEVRIWSAFQLQSLVYANMYTPFTGDEVGLVGYWQMDEAFGKTTVDKARSRNAIIAGNWLVLPKGKAVQFDGSKSLSINTASTVVISNQMDMTLEFWFNAKSGQTNTTLFSSGKGDGTDQFNSGNVSININANGKIQVLYNNTELLASGDADNFVDDNWHHIALSLQRNANATLYIDGDQKASVQALNLGGMLGAQMYMGVRGYKLTASQVTKDRYFVGQIDELRIWNLARKRDQLLLDRNSKLSGNELGLVAYYPFESYQTVSGIKMMTPTLADQWVNSNGANGGTATGDALFSDSPPNIKDARPVTNVDFTWAVNSDQIVITPSSALAAQIEKAVIEITVSRIEDRYQNRLVSPITWTAYADRNPLKWDNDNLSLSKKLLDDQTFTVKVVNKGGTQQNFTIKNLPAWLSVSPTTGSLSPESTTTVTFTVNKGLNTGYFSEDIYLSGDFGYDEKLHLELRVYTPEPAWSVDASKFQYSMNIIGMVKLNGIISTDVYDRAAAFVNGECRGVAYLKYVDQFDQYQAYIDIYSNVETGEAIELRVWDASKGQEYTNVTPNSIIFAANTVIGSPSVPQIISAGTNLVQSVSLEAGWNWKSFNVQSSQLANLNTLLSGLTAQSGDMIKGQSYVDVFSTGTGWSGTISSGGGFQNGKMYMMKIQNGGSFEVNGSALDPSFSIALKAGWNWIGVVPQFNITVNEALASWPAVNGDIIKGKRSFSTYQDGLGWIGSLSYILPGEGYLVKATNDATLVYPSTTSLSAGREQIQETSKQYWPLDATKLQNNMSLIGQLDTNEKDQWVVGAFANKVCYGFAEPQDVSSDKTLYFLTIHGDGGEKLNFKALNTTTGEIKSIVQTMPFSVNNIMGSFETPLSFTFGTSSEDTEDTEVLIYPNPTNDLVTVILPDDGFSHTLNLADLRGCSLKKVAVPAGVVKATFNLNEDNISAGIYLVSIEGGTNVKTVKVIKN